jgi:hypothetical protein
MHPSKVQDTYVRMFVRAEQQPLYRYPLESCKGKQYNKLCTVLLFLAFNPSASFFSYLATPALVPDRVTMAVNVLHLLH